MDIGKRIKALRIKCGLTLEELAARSELSKGFLSQLERDLTTTTVATLEDIVEVLGSDLETFFKAPKEDKIVFSDKDYFINDNGDSCVTWLVPNAQKNAMEPILLTLKPEGSSREIKPHEGEEFGYVLKGRIILRDLTNQNDHPIKKGETFYMAGDVRYVLLNRSSNEAQVIWVSNPPIF